MIPTEDIQAILPDVMPPLPLARGPLRRVGPGGELERVHELGIFCASLSELKEKVERALEGRELVSRRTRWDSARQMFHSYMQSWPTPSCSPTPTPTMKVYSAEPINLPPFPWDALNLVLVALNQMFQENEIPFSLTATKVASKGEDLAEPPSEPQVVLTLFPELNAHSKSIEDILPNFGEGVYGSFARERDGRTERISEQCISSPSLAELKTLVEAVKEGQDVVFQRTCFDPARLQFECTLHAWLPQV
jgi:hypothetical protein